MKHKTEALAVFALMYILSEYEVDQELKDKVYGLFTEVYITEGNDASAEEVLQEAIKVLEKFVSKNKVQSIE